MGVWPLKLVYQFNGQFVALMPDDAGRLEDKIILLCQAEFRPESLVEASMPFGGLAESNTLGITIESIPRGDLSPD